MIKAAGWNRGSACEKLDVAVGGTSAKRESVVVATGDCCQPYKSVLNAVCCLLLHLHTNRAQTAVLAILPSTICGWRQ